MVAFAGQTMPENPGIWSWRQTNGACSPAPTIHTSSHLLETNSKSICVAPRAANSYWRWQVFGLMASSIRSSPMLDRLLSGLDSVLHGEGVLVIDRNSAVAARTKLFSPLPWAGRKGVTDFVFSEARFLRISGSHSTMAAVDPFRPGRYIIR